MSSRAKIQIKMNREFRLLTVLPTLFLAIGLLSFGYRSKAAVNVRITVKNQAPEQGTYQTPVWVGVHDGTFDLFDLESPASPALERLAEDGSVMDINQLFTESEAGGVQTTIISGGDIPPFAPRQSNTVVLELDPTNPRHRYISFASMVIPSNDAFIGNSNPQAHPIFDDNGALLQDRILISNLAVYDAGTEVNDEVPENTAFLAQAAPNTGESEGGVVRLHPGFADTGSGGVVDQDGFANASINRAGDQPLALSLGEAIQINTVTAENGQLRIGWTGGQAPFRIETRDNINSGLWITRDLAEERSSSVAAADPHQFVRVVEEVAFPTETARYEVEFDSDWSAALHPTDFPSFPHFSGLIGTTHHGEFQLWGPEFLASPGIRSMAETGGKTPLRSEIEAQITGGAAEHLLSGGGISRSPGRVSLTFPISQSHSLVSLVSMVAPSPDWFVGVHDLNLFVDGDWISELSVPLYAYDAGTDSGASFTSPNRVTNPPQGISRIVEAPFDEALNLLPLGRFNFTRLE